MTNKNNYTREEVKEIEDKFFDLMKSRVQDIKQTKGFLIIPLDKSKQRIEYSWDSRPISTWQKIKRWFR